MESYITDDNSENDDNIGTMMGDNHINIGTMMGDNEIKIGSSKRKESSGMHKMWKKIDEKIMKPLFGGRKRESHSVYTDDNTDIIISHDLQMVELEDQ